MAWRQIISYTRAIPASTPFGFSRSFSNSTPFVVKVGIPEFLNGVGGGVEAHVVKLESEIGDFQKLLVTRTLKLKKLGIPCKHVGAVEATSSASEGTMKAVWLQDDVRLWLNPTNRRFFLRLGILGFLASMYVTFLLPCFQEEAFLPPFHDGARIHIRIPTP